MGSEHKDKDEDEDKDKDKDKDDGVGCSSSSSSSDDDGDEQWRAAINDVASSTTFVGCPPPPSSITNLSSSTPDQDHQPQQQPPLKHYQLKAQKALYDMLEKSLVFVKDPIPTGMESNNPEENKGGVRLFKKSPIGILFDHKDEPKGPRKKPRILPGEEINEKSKKFKRRVQSVVVEGADILTSAKDACQKSLVKWQTKEAAAWEAAKREEERVAQLKKIRGERWLPSVARYMQIKSKVST